MSLVVAFTHPCANCGKTVVVVHDSVHLQLDGIYCDISCRVEYKLKMDTWAQGFIPIDREFEDDEDGITAFHLHPP